MSDLNVTDGEWVVVDNGDGSASVQFNKDGEHVVDYVYNKNDAYLIAQAKKMYEMLNLAISLMDGDSIEDFTYQYKEIQKTLNACKPEEDQ